MTRRILAGALRHTVSERDAALQLLAEERAAHRATVESFGTLERQAAAYKELLDRLFAEAERRRAATQAHDPILEAARRTSARGRAAYAGRARR